MPTPRASGGARLSPTEKLRLIQIAVFSVDDTITATEAIALIASVFAEDPIVRLDRDRLAELLTIVTVPAKPRKGARRLRGAG